MMTRHKANLKILSMTLCLVLCLSTPTKLSANESKAQTLLIMTPYPQFITQAYRSSFKHYHPNIELEIIKKETSDAIKHLLKNKNENIVDIFWASSPDTFKKLKSGNILLPYNANTRGIPKIISGVQISDVDNAYTGYALSGFGFMWNTHYLRIKELPIPENWESLKEDKYFDHIAMSTPTQSGTTHITVENILQTRGWENGWKLIKLIAANTKELSERSGHVPKKVQKGESGIGIVIDYYGLSSKAQHYPVDFAYPEPAILLPASAAIIKNSPTPDAARKFIDFLVSSQGQSLLLDKKSRRIPILPATYDEAPTDYPNPYEDDKLADTFDFDINLSVKRHELINTLFEALLTDNFSSYKKAIKQTNTLRKSLIKQENIQAKQLLEQAETHLSWIPKINEETSQDDNFLLAFNSDNSAKEYQKTWSSEAQKQYKQAQQLAEQGLKVLEEKSN